MSTTILLVDDHEMFREGVKALLAREPDLVVVGDAGTGAEVPPLVGALHPNVVVLDISLPDVSGLEVLSELKGQPSRSLIMSMYSSEDDVAAAMSRGAAGYLTKSDGPGELVAAVRAIAGGDTYYSKRLRRRPATRKSSDAVDRYDTLTSREKQVIAHVVKGDSNARIANRLDISVRTVEVHRANALRKLKVRTLAELVRYCIRRGITPLDD